MEIDEIDLNQPLRAYKGRSTASDMLEQLAKLLNYKFIPETRTSWCNIRRLDGPGHEFRLWYNCISYNFYYNYGVFKESFKYEPTKCNDLMIAQVIEMIEDFEKHARKLELKEHIDSIHDAAKAYALC